MREMVWLAVGIAAGWMLGRWRRDDGDGPARRAPKPTKRQRAFLATLDPAPERPTIEQLVAEELAEVGADRIPGAEGVAAHVRLRVYRRDGPALTGCADELLRFVVTEGIDPARAVEEDVRLVCEDGRGNDGTRSGGSASPG